MRSLTLTAAVLSVIALAPAYAGGRPGALVKSKASHRRPAMRPAPRTVRPQLAYRKSLVRALRTLERQGRPAIVKLDSKLPTIVIPDVHARTNYIASVLKSKEPVSGRRYGELLRAGKVQIVVVGDGMHSEARAETRWLQAEAAPLGKAMKSEIGESLGTMKQIMELKAAYPDHFHYLKGNHDNILDEQRGGNYPVVKYTSTGEGKLVRDYIVHRFGEKFLQEYAAFERSLPLVAVGNELAISHSAPEQAMDPARIRRRGSSAVSNFTWTDLTHDTAKQARIVKKQLRKLGLSDGALYLAGHRPTGARRYRRQGQLIQVNSDDKLLYVVVEPGRRFDASRDVRRARPIR